MTEVYGYGRTPSEVLVCAEAPGSVEASTGIPLTGPTGREHDAYLRRDNLNPRSFYKTNVIKTYIEGNPDPTPDLIAYWTDFLISEVHTVNPCLILAVGRFAMRWFLGADATLEACAGIPHRPGHFDPALASRAPEGCVILPLMHPAAGLHDSDARSLISRDYSAVAPTLRAIRSGSPIPYPYDAYEGRERYSLISGHDLACILMFDAPDDIAIDTEGIPGAEDYIQLCWEPGTAYAVDAADPTLPELVEAILFLALRGTVLTGHNWMWDLAVCRGLGLHLRNPAIRIYDTMGAAYLSRLEPQGLKPLSWRKSGMRMTDYMTTIGDEVGKVKQLAYLEQVVSRSSDWPKPDPRIVFENDGRSRLYTPKRVALMAQAIIADVLAGKVTKEGPTDPLKRWKGVDPIQRAMVESALGRMPVATLKDIPLDQAIFYACRDADATIRNKPALHAQVSLSLIEDFNDLLPVFEEMQATGMPASRSYFESLSAQMWEEFCDLQAQLSRDYCGGRPINPLSADHVRTLMRRRGLTGRKKTKTGEVSTAKGSIEYLKYTDPAIRLVFECRERLHIRNSFCATALAAIPNDPTPVAASDRDDPEDEPVDASTMTAPSVEADIVPVRCSIKTTRVATRRLASAKPNLLAIPSRTKLGLAVRHGYQCEMGRLFGAWDLCLAPGTRVLTSDLKWRPIEEIREGDRLVAIDEDSRSVIDRRGVLIGRPRRLQTSVVEKVGRRIAASCRITLSNGVSIVASREHPWLVRNRNRGLRKAWTWVNTSDLLVGEELCKLVDPWKEEKTWEAGWLAGIFDGEGSFDRLDATITLTQNAGEVIDFARSLLLERGYDFHEPYSKDGGFPGSSRSQHIWMCGMLDCIRLIGSIRPKRFLKNVEKLWEGKELRRHHQKKFSPNCHKPVTVVSVEDIGDCEVVSMQTSTRTFVAEGFFTHNSQIEARVLAHLSRDPLLCRLFNDRRDIHIEVAARVSCSPDLWPLIDTAEHAEIANGWTLTLSNNTVLTITKDQRRAAKTTVYGIVYGQQGQGLLTELWKLGLTSYDLPACEALRSSVLDVFSGVRAYIEDVGRRTRAHRDGLVRDYWGMPRYLPGIHSPEDKVSSEAVRHAVSHEVQGTAQGMIRNSMRWLRPTIYELQQAGIDVRWNLQVHDELILSFPPDAADLISALVLEALTDHAGIRLCVPVEADGHTAETWGALK